VDKTIVGCTVCELHAESTFRVEGMDCREEVTLIERRFKALPGLEDFVADVMGQRLHVKYDAAKLTTSAIVGAVADAGMRAWLEHEEPLHTGSSNDRVRMTLLAAAGTCLGVGLALEGLSAPAPAASMLFAASVACGVPLTARRAWQALRSASLDINVLMLVAVAGAAVLGEWSEAAAVVFLFALAQMLEVRTLARARQAVRALLDLTPAAVLVREPAGDRMVAADALSPGAVVVVKPGEKLALDGEVVTGRSAVNQAPVTGESLPIEKSVGDAVFAGSINGHGALEVRVTRFRRDTTLARVIHLVERAQAQRAPAQTFVERFARIYTPSVLGLAVLLALVPPFFADGDWHTWLYRALVLLVVSCPCALVISTPVSVVAALAGAARKGVLIKGGAHLERAGAVRCVAFDKTGTLTTGRPEVVAVLTLDGIDPARLIALAASVEQRSNHPIAGAILRYAEHRQISGTPARDVCALVGQGAEGLVDGLPVLVGNHRLFEERKLCSDALHALFSEVTSDGRTAVLVAYNGAAAGVIGVADRPRRTTSDAVDALRRQGVESVVMLTGDSADTARSIASEIGVDDFYADLMPEGKVEVLEGLKRRFGSVAMVGDGVNDAPALAFADVGIAMGAAGSDIAIETADVALMSDELMKVPYALRLSRAAVNNIRANLAISLVLKGAFVVAAAVGAATLWMAVLADTGASVIVIDNALRLLRAQ
jgi:Cd2+/Zn2+-exporting ATPase